MFVGENMVMVAKIVKLGDLFEIQRGLMVSGW